jgi:hypothetical protein
MTHPLHLAVVPVLAAALLVPVPTALAQGGTLIAGFHVAMSSLEELDDTDVGIGGRLSIHAAPLVALEGELSYFPSDIPGTTALSSFRLEGLFGAKVGPRFGRFALFAKLRGGFLRFAEAPEPVACIAIFPPPLGCVLAEGDTLPAIDVGGGIELFPSERSVVRIDVSSLLLRYPGPAFRRSGEVFSGDGVWGGNVRITVGAGVRF